MRYIRHGDEKPRVAVIRTGLQGRINIAQVGVGPEGADGGLGQQIVKNPSPVRAGQSGGYDIPNTPCGWTRPYRAWFLGVRQPRPPSGLRRTPTWAILSRPCRPVRPRRTSTTYANDERPRRTATANGHDERPRRTATPNAKRRTPTTHPRIMPPPITKAINAIYAPCAMKSRVLLSIPVRKRLFCPLLT